jgi:hypothetical protein
MPLSTLLNKIIFGPIYNFLIAALNKQAQNRLQLSPNDATPALTPMSLS